MYTHVHDPNQSHYWHKHVVEQKQEPWLPWNIVEEPSLSKSLLTQTHRGKEKEPWLPWNIVKESSLSSIYIYIPQNTQKELLLPQKKTVKRTSVLIVWSKFLKKTREEWLLPQNIVEENKCYYCVNKIAQKNTGRVTVTSKHSRREQVSS
jgi:hypothetical protein